MASLPAGINLEIRHDRSDSHPRLGGRMCRRRF